MDRISRLLGTSTRSTRILEIGASYMPTAPKAGGWNTFVVDYASREELLEKYAGDGVAEKTIEAIEEVDAIWRDGSLHDAVPTALHGSFDTLIASHVIEHIPDLAAFLISAQHLLKPTGVVALAIPDRRFCFDYFKPHSMTGDVLEAHMTRRTRHTLRTVWSQAAYSVVHNGIVAWGPHPVDWLDFADSFSVAQAKYRAFSDESSVPYSDCHAWHFTPAGFALVILEVGQLGVIDWYIETLHGPEGNEFFAFLRRGVAPIADLPTLQECRMRLLRIQLVEMQQQLGFAAAFLRGNPEQSASNVPDMPVPAIPNQQIDQLAEVTAMLRGQQAGLQDRRVSRGVPHVAPPRVLVAERFVSPVGDLQLLHMPDDVRGVAPGQELDAVVMDELGSHCRRVRIAPPPPDMPGNRIEFEAIRIPPETRLWLFVIDGGHDDGTVTPTLVNNLLKHGRRLERRPPITLIWDRGPAVPSPRKGMD